MKALCVCVRVCVTHILCTVRYERIIPRIYFGSARFVLFFTIAIHYTNMKRKSSMGTTHAEPVVGVAHTEPVVGVVRASAAEPKFENAQLLVMMLMC